MFYNRGKCYLINLITLSKFCFGPPSAHFVKKKIKENGIKWEFSHGRGGSSIPVRPPSPPDHRCSVRLAQRSLFKMDTWQALYPPSPASDSSQPEHPAVSVHGDQHDSDRPCPESPPGHYGRRNRGASEKESTDRAPTEEVAVDGASANET